jgi:hypothetical protein
LIIDYSLTSFDSTLSTASAVYHVICELAAHPEAADILREELDQLMVDWKLPDPSARAQKNGQLARVLSITSG